MTATIDREGCIGCALCAETCPTVFRMTDGGYAEVYTDPVPADAESAVDDAIDSCPVSVISAE